MDEHEDFLKAELKLGRDDVFKVDTKNTFSFFNVENNQAELVLQKLNGIKVNDRIVSVEVTEHRERDRGRSRNRNRNRSGKRFGNDGGNFRGSKSDSRRGRNSKSDRSGSLRVQTQQTLKEIDLIP